MVLSGSRSGCCCFCSTVGGGVEAIEEVDEDGRVVVVDVFVPIEKVNDPDAEDEGSERRIALVIGGDNVALDGKDDACCGGELIGLCTSIDTWSSSSRNSRWWRSGLADGTSGLSSEGTMGLLVWLRGGERRSNRLALDGAVWSSENDPGEKKKKIKKQKNKILDTFAF